jgi:NADPH:quinone reductase-like Zn-dependent oxidoreductase
MNMLTMAKSPDGGLEALQAPIPEPGPTEVLIKSSVVGLNPVDRKTLAGLGVSSFYDEDEPMIVGWDVVGVVEQVGDGVTRLKRGDRVFGMPSFPWPARAYAEYVVSQSRQVAVLPDAVSDLDAAALCLSGLTAWQAVIDTLEVGSGDRILIHAAAGGVGHIAVQLAIGRGAEVWATASARHHEGLRELGVENVIDYRSQPFEDSVRGMNIVLDLVGLHDYPRRSLECLRPGGRLLVIPSADLIPDRGVLEERGVTGQWMLVEPDYPALERLGTMAAYGELKPLIAAHRPLRQIEQLWKLAEDGAPIGKLAATVG